MLERAVEQLKEALYQEQLMYSKLLELEKNKTDIIQKGKIRQLEEMTKQEQQYLMKMGTFEKIRRSVFINTSEVLETNEIGSLSEFLLYLEDEQAITSLDQLRNQLLATIDGIHEANEQNKKLLEQHLEYIHISLDLMTQHLTEGNDNNYSGKANEKQKTKTHLFDARV